MAGCEKNLDTSEIYHSALDNLMNNLHISSTPELERSGFSRLFGPVDEDKFFIFCSTIKKYSKSYNATKDKCENSKQQNYDADGNKIPATNVRETPKRSVTTTRKLKLFKDTEEAATKDKCENNKQQNYDADDNKTPAINVRETPKRSVTTIRKQKLFKDTESAAEVTYKLKTRSLFNEKVLSPKSLLLRKAITRLECIERRQALSKKTVRTSLRV